jgi:predicted nucleic acid-binding protein
VGNLYRSGRYHRDFVLPSRESDPVRSPILDFTPAEAKVFAELQADLIRNGRTRPVIDLCIAATALRHGGVLATLNSRDFADISDLMVED